MPLLSTVSVVKACATALHLAAVVAMAEPPASGKAQTQTDEAGQDHVSTGGDGDGDGDGDARHIVVPTRSPDPDEPRRAGSVVTRRELDERLPRSAPDALRYEPGVYVQQSAHGQGSAYVRGLTGQQTVLVFDGIRLNTSTFRQGPNQYFFTVDSHTIEHIEVVRGSASTRFGSDALGGALLTTPRGPALEEVTDAKHGAAHGLAQLTTATQDLEAGGRGEVALARPTRLGTLGLLMGAGYRDVQDLRSGGRFRAPATGALQTVPPRFLSDLKTQAGTGFSEFAGDARMVWSLPGPVTLTAAHYDFRQFDVPRTDQCPPKTAPEDECLRYEEQFRSLTYHRLDVEDGPVAAAEAFWTVSYQRNHERRRLDRGSPSSTVVFGEDDVHTLGTAAKVSTAPLGPGPTAEFRVRYGGDLYLDQVRSRSWLYFGDVDIRSDLSRGQYLDGGRYLTSGAFAQGEASMWSRVDLHAGGRLAAAAARAEGDAATSSAPVEATWIAPVGFAGIAVRPAPWLSAVANVDQGFRAPNLDDLTSRQQTGPGFQFENPNLKPERSTSLEGGFRVRHEVIDVDAFVFHTWLDDMIVRAPAEVGDCPLGDPGCAASATRFQLTNGRGLGTLWGVDGGLRLYLPLDLGLSTSLSWARGDMPNPLPRPTTPSPSYRDNVPISRVPPLNGTVELGWRPTRWGAHVSAALRWATVADRLAPADVADVRIPAGGTPGYAVVDLRAGYRFDPWFLVAVALENVTDAAYRYHGSSINGPGRGVRLDLRFGF